MNNFKLIKNTEWKEIEINGEMKYIPINWEVINIDKSFKVVGGGTPPTREDTYWNGNIAWIGPKEMSKEKTQYIGLGEKNISELGAKKLGNKKVLKDSIIISTRAPVGYIKFAKNDLYTNQGCHSLLPNNEFNNQYMFYWVLKNKKILEKNASGTTFKELSSGNLKSIEFSYPKISQQSSIANILSAQESIIQDIESLISKYESRFQYLSEELLSGRLRIKELDGQLSLYKNADDNWKEVEINGEMIDIPKDWEVDKVVNFTKLIKGASIPENKTNYEGKGIKYLKTTEFWMDASSKRTTAYAEAGYYSEHLKTKDEYVISFDGFNKEIGKGTVGLVSCEGEGIVSTHFFKIEKNPYYHFSVNLLRTNKVQNQIVANADGSISLSATKFAKSMKIQKPKLIEEMILISDVLEPNHNLIQAKKELLQKEKQKFEWLLDNLLSGKYIVQEQ